MSIDALTIILSLVGAEMSNSRCDGNARHGHVASTFPCQKEGHNICEKEKIKKKFSKKRKGLSGDSRKVAPARFEFQIEGCRARLCEAGRGVSRLDKLNAREKRRRPNTRDSEDECKNIHQVTVIIVNGNNRSS